MSNTKYTIIDTHFDLVVFTGTFADCRLAIAGIVQNDLLRAGRYIIGLA